MLHLHFLLVSKKNDHCSYSRVFILLLSIYNRSSERETINPQSDLWASYSSLEKSVKSVQIPADPPTHLKDLKLALCKGTVEEYLVWKKNTHQRCPSASTRLLQNSVLRETGKGPSYLDLKRFNALTSRGLAKFISKSYKVHFDSCKSRLKNQVAKKYVEKQHQVWMMDSQKSKKLTGTQQ